MNQLAVQQDKQKIGDRPQDELDESQNLFLTFMVGGETYGIGILAIKEILEYCDVTRVPMMPDFIQGVVNVRGSVVPVIDLSLRLGSEPTGANKRTCIVIIEAESEGEVIDIGVVVDAVNEVLEIPAGEIEATPAFGAKIRTDFIQGMGKVQDKFIILLDVEHVLSVEELSILDQVTRDSEVSPEDHVE
ncbi:MAG: chemotaxis protein CheW [Gammaproteobacteria bacterium]|nr:chemotaxis protein CheW [Gammaproteobacteria bacterium]